MSRIRTEKFSHSCPVEECEGEVTLEYEVGKGREDFLLWMEYEEIQCDLGHPITQEWADSKWNEDCQEMGERESERLERAYDDHMNSLIDVRRGK